jgi:MSHA biogenesis protein MshQ
MTGRQRWHARFATFCILLAGLMVAPGASAAAKFARTGGNWSAITWSTTSCTAGTGAAVPTAADDVTICDNITVTVNTSPTILSLTFLSGANPSILQITSALTMTVTGTVTATGGTASGANKQILLSNNAVFNVNGDVTLTGAGNDNRFALLQLNGATSSIGGSLNINGLAGTSRARVTLANTSTLNVGNDIVIGAGSLLDNGNTTTSVINASGDFNHTGTYSSTGGTCNFVGTSAQAIGGSTAITTTFFRVAFNNTGGDITINHPVQVANGGTLTLTSGRVVTGANSVAVGATGSATLSGGNTASYVIGNLARYIRTGTQSGIQFPVGGTTAGKYAPVQIDFPNVTTAGLFQVAASTGNTDHPNISLSAIDSSSSVNRYWTLTNTGGLTFSGATTANATFNYPASDIDSGADTTAFIVGDYTSGSWSYPTTGTLGSTSTQVTGLTAAAIPGDYAIGDFVGPFSYWRMNEASWNGTANEVLDFGSGGNPGNAASLSATKPTTANTTPAIAGSPGTCRYGVFNRTNKDYISLPTTYPDLATQSFTITSWIRTTDNTQPGQRIMIDDEGTTGGWGFSLGDGVTAALRIYSRGSATNTLDTGSIIANNVWYFVAATMAINGTTTIVTIYVYNQAGALVATPTTATWTGFTWGNDPGRPSLGGETNASSEGNNAFGFAGNIDEVRVYRAALSQNQVNQVRQLTNPCQVTDHYAIIGSTTAVTCDTTSVQIIAHDTTHTAVAPTAGTLLTLSTSTGTGVWQAGLLAGSGGWGPSGANNGAATYTWPGGESTFTVNLRNSTVASLNINLSDSNGKSEASTEDLIISFVGSGFRVTTNGTTTATIPTQLSGKNSNTGFNAQTLFLQAIRTDTNTGSCVGAIQSQTATIQMAGTRVNPTGGSSQVSALNSSNALVALGTGAGTTGTFTNITLAFDAQSKAPLVLNYPDAGSISVSAQFQLPAPPASTFITGASNVFVVRPFGFAFRGANAATAIQHGTTAASTLLAAAGDNFTMTMVAYQWAAGEDTDNDGIPDAGVDLTNNGTTPNFAASVSVTPTANLPGAAVGSVSRGATCASAATIAAGNFASGVATLGDWCYSEAGNVLLTATSTDYIATGVNITGNSGLDGTGAAAGYVGRFRPKNFTLNGPGTLVNRSASSCSPASAFTYMGENMTLGFTLLARNTQGVTTQNYTGAYAKLGLNTFSNFVFGAKNGTTDLSSRIATTGTPTGTWSNGIGAVSTFASISRAASPDGAYAALQFGIAPSDGEGVAMSAFDLDVNNDSVNDHTNLGVTTEVRFGRLALNNVFGSELLDLPLSMQTQYFSNGIFQTNTLDSCTTLAASNIRMAAVATPDLATTCKTSLSPTGTIFFTGGKASSAAPPATVVAPKLTKPGAGNSGTVRLTVNLDGTSTGNTCTPGSTAVTSAAQVWLQGNWAGTSYNSNPAANATFGQYKGADEFIYFRELY